VNVVSASGSPSSAQTTYFSIRLSAISSANSASVSMCRAAARVRIGANAAAYMA
jgi:hypothetical protein